MAPAKKARISQEKKLDTSTTVKEKKKTSRNDKDHHTFKVYINRVFKQNQSQDQHLSMSKKAMTIADQFIVDIFEGLCSEAAAVCRYHKKQTMSAREIQCAVKLIFPGELAKHAINEGTKQTVRLVCKDE